MSFLSPIRLVWPNRKSLFLPIAAVALALVFIVTLHPASGAAGGFVFLLVGWVIPSAINLLAAAWIVLFFRAHWSLKTALFVVVSFILGINVSIPDLFKHAPQTIVNSKIIRAVHINAASPIDDRLSATSQTPMNYVFGPTPLGVSVSPDEGCMCMYFDYGDGARTYYNQIQDYIYQIGRSRPDHKFYFFDPLRSPDVIHFDVEFTKAVMTHAVNVKVDIYDGIKKTATYSQYNLPYLSFDTNSIGRGRPLMSEHFYSYSESMLLRHNFWTYLLKNQISGIPISPFKMFLSRALPVN